MWCGGRREDTGKQLGGEGQLVVSLDEVSLYESQPMWFVPAYPQNDLEEIPLPPSQAWEVPGGFHRAM